jgi:hypothetical protein
MKISYLYLFFHAIEFAFLRLIFNESYSQSQKFIL